MDTSSVGLKAQDSDFIFPNHIGKDPISKEDHISEGNEFGGDMIEPR